MFALKLVETLSSLLANNVKTVTVFLLTAVLLFVKLNLAGLAQEPTLRFAKAYVAMVR